MAFLERIVLAIAASNDIAVHMQSIVRETTEVTGTQVCSLYIWDEKASRLTLTATHGLPPHAVGDVQLALGEGITGWVAEHRQPLVVEDVHLDPRFVWIPDVDEERFVSMLSVPIILGDRLLGVLNVQTDGAHRFARDERELLVAIAAHLAGIIEITGLHRELALTEALRSSEEQLRQAQKMEAVGRLAGGVAHDFNNLLTAIIGWAELVHGALPPGSELVSQVQEIVRAGERASDLTRQLLAFSRQQLLRPEVLDLNAVVENMGGLLRRVIGEDINLAIVTAPDLGWVRVDRGQLEQVILNLAVNARDAMPRGGRLVIETTRVDLDVVDAQAWGSRTLSAVQEGSGVVLAVSDTGTGMDEETRARIFEPFFTTKDLGKGTGLGLSTVYGIVQQSGGGIWVYSEPGLGTTFKIYLPRVQAEGVPQRRVEAPAPTGGTETILVVEDEPGVRALVCTVLQQAGYQVLEAADPEAAQRLAGAYAERIDLLLTDFVLPTMNGLEIARILAGNRPEMRCLYMSGYTDDVMMHHGVSTAELVFLQKPFTPAALLTAVRAALDSPTPAIVPGRI
jgi:signal transduction histidine kinase/CheY-like chemotaxis protein